jgi:hypothetical protein
MLERGLPREVRERLEEDYDRVLVGYKRAQERSQNALRLLEDAL